MNHFFSKGAVCSLNSKELLIGWGEPYWCETPQGYPVWYAPDFFLNDSKPYLHFPNTKVIGKDILLCQQHSHSFKFESPRWDSFEAYFELFKNLGLKKAVPYVQKQAFVAMSPTIIEGMFHHCLKYINKNPSTFLYGFWDQNQGMLGVTPEIVVSIENNTLNSLACAGTAPSQLASSMLSDPKLFREHEMVIEGLRNELQPFGEVAIGETLVRTYSKIAHLVTTLEIKNFKTESINKIIAAIHPSPAIGAYPKIEGKAYLNSLELKLPRIRFGAPFGIIQEENAHIYLAIRNIQWKGNQAFIMAGCGIVSESILQNEKQEILEKLSAIDEILGIG